MNKKEKEFVANLVRSIEDFPEKGVIFRDITTALKNKEGLVYIIRYNILVFKKTFISFL